MPACPAASSRSMARCELASIHSALSTARRRSRRLRGRLLRLAAGDHFDKAAARTWPISSSPTSLLPSAAVCASSPSTISSGSGGARADLPDRPQSPIASTSSGAEEERQALVADGMVMGADIFVAGIADQDGACDQFVEAAATTAAKTALADIGERMGRKLLPQTACRPVPRCSGIRSPKCGCPRAASCGSSARSSYACGSGQRAAAAPRTGSCSRSGERPRW